MLHIATVHWMNDNWIQVQRDYFEKFAGGSCKFYGFVNGIEKDYSHMFDFYSTEMISCCSAAGQNHGTKLNILADIIASQANDDEIIVFPHTLFWSPYNPSLSAREIEFKLKKPSKGKFLIVKVAGQTIDGNPFSENLIRTIR